MLLTFRDVAILVPHEDHLFGQDLSLVEEQYNLVETLEKILVVVAELLDLV